MEYHRFGRTGVTVSNLCLGAMMFGEWGMHSAGAEARPGHITTLGFLAMCIFANGK